MEPSLDDYVFIQFGVRPTVLAELRAAACHADLSIEQWLTQLLIDGVRRDLPSRRVV